MTLARTYVVNWCNAWSSFSYSTLSCRNDQRAFTSPRRMTASTLRYWWYCTPAMATYATTRPAMISRRKCLPRIMVWFLGSWEERVD
ncbi:hypothetical protein D3C72_2372660 [compost metagenome]